MLGHGPIDEDHRQLVLLIAAVTECTPDEMPAAMDALSAHCMRHFAAEDALMLESGFPAHECHAGEHAAVLGSVHGVTQRVKAGDSEAGRALARALADWFPGHADYLDAALVHWLCKRRWGGKPVVLRRDLRAHANLNNSLDLQVEQST